MKHEQYNQVIILTLRIYLSQELLGSSMRHKQEVSSLKESVRAVRLEGETQAAAVLRQAQAKDLQVICIQLVAVAYLL
jgi:hypothetical protein